jgi:glycosyltransferase involved in cell wall biosynthesis
MSDLFITSYPPVRTSGRGVRTCSVIMALARLGPIEVAYLPFGGANAAKDLQADERVTLRRLEPSRGVRRLLAAARAIAAGAPKDLARSVSPEVMAVARQAPAGTRVIADGPTAAAALLPSGRVHDAVYLAHNLETSFRTTVPNIASFERKVLRSFRESWMATDGDIEGARELAGEGLALRYVPNVVDVHALPVVGTPPGKRNTLFVADFSYEPNLEGLAYLVDDVMPLVWAELPDATVTVVGRGIETPPSDPRVHVLGFVDDLDAAYADADAAVVPLLTGGGSPLKLVEALAHGMPVVVSSHAAELLPHGSAPEHFLAAPDPPGMASALVSVLRGEHPDLGRRARALAEDQFSMEVLVRLLGEAARP